MTLELPTGHNDEISNSKKKTSYENDSWFPLSRSYCLQVTTKNKAFFKMLHPDSTVNSKRQY